MSQYVTFKLDDQFYGIDILYVREIVQPQKVTDVQQAPAYIRGLINLRGQIVTIIDTALRMGMEPRDTDGPSHNIILKSESELVTVRAHENREDLHTSEDPAGLLVDEYGEVVLIDDELVEPPPANVGEQEAKFLSGVFKNNDQLFSIVDVRKLVSMD